MCQPCYRRDARYGTPEYERIDLDDLTYDFVVQNCTRSGECLIWTGVLGKEGFPQTADRKLWREEGKQRQIRIHRWMYESQVGELRKGQQVRQTCGNKLCVFPGHLEVSTPRPGRSPLGEAGQYKGRKKRDDDGERCANGHEWTEETLYVDRRDRRVCRACQAASHVRSKGGDASAHEWKRRKSWEDTPQCANGHLFEEHGWYFNGEARVCRKCFAEKERVRWLRVNYGLTLEDFKKLLADQDFTCSSALRFSIRARATWCPALITTTLMVESEAFFAGHAILAWDTSKTISGA
ncbi:hypothetical protein GCM10022419_119390 [Nonomuraea rosea]|uniref:HNH endonuclease n=1 Tax=Nonomuraea rosea TaxID=638574 RepID=A0ABP6ZQ10_9ACTN